MSADLRDAVKDAGYAAVGMDRSGVRFYPDQFLSALSAAGWVAEQGWQPIETAPQDRMVLVYAPSPDPTRWHTSVCDLSPIICAAKWHPEGGWCVCEIREVTHWRPVPAAPQEDRE